MKVGVLVDPGIIVCEFKSDSYMIDCPTSLPLQMIALDVRFNDLCNNISIL